MKTPATLLGLAIGDALGQPFEFSTAEQIIKSGWDGSFKGSQWGFEGMWELDPGQWTDDTCMAICISESLLESNGFNIDNLAEKYINWVKSKDVRGIGIRTESSIHNMIRGVPPMEAGKKHAGRPKPSFKRISTDPAFEAEKTGDLHALVGDFCGCGTVMRCAPIGLFFHKQEKELVKASRDDATMTHDHPDARDSSELLCRLIADLVNGCDPKKKLWDYILNNDFEYDHCTKLAGKALELAGCKETTFVDAIPLGVRGTAHETLATALYCFIRYPSFKEAVTASVLMGGDCDSRGAIVGALAGTYYGLEGIPEDWVSQVEDTERLQNLDEQLYEKSYNG